MLPRPLVEEFWHDVEEELVTAYKHSRPEAVKGITDYRERLAEHGVGDIQYHASPADTAAAIDAGIQDGFPKPANAD